MKPINWLINSPMGVLANTVPEFYLIILRYKNGVAYIEGVTGRSRGELVRG